MSAVTGEAMGEGIGYIPIEYLAMLLKIDINETKNLLKVNNSLGVQVRIFIPRRGIFKGMLMPMPPGMRQKGKILLTPSMRKVGPSRLPNPAPYAYVVVKQQVRSPTTVTRHST